MKKAIIYETTFGRIGIAEENGFVTNLFFKGSVAPKDFETKETPLLRRAGKQLLTYLEGKRREFDLPLRPEGTPFQQEVWQALLTIPFGQTRTYGEIAAQIGRPKACRAVGQANGLNPISIFIPCHRVIGTGNKLTGYSGGLALKKKLLNLEADPTS